MSSAALGHCPISGTWCSPTTTRRWAPRASCREGALEERVAYVRRVTGKPVVGVGRFTSPDAMLRQLQRGVLDLIGAARPVDRRSVPADQDQRGPPRGHPRVHRLQHLLRQQLPRRAAALHAEPDHGRGVALGLASRARAARRRRHGAGRRRRARRARGGAARSASAATRSRSPRPPTRRADASRARAACRASPSGRACATTASGRSVGCRTSRSTSATACWSPTCASSVPTTC